MAVYVAPDGALSYTIAHSAAIPEGSIRDGWTRTARADPTDPLGSLSFAGGLIACPREEGQAWQVYGQIEGVEAPSTECLGFGAITCEFHGDCRCDLGTDSRTDNATEAAAWQY